MNKKKYVAPFVEVLEMESSTLMSASDGRTVGYDKEYASNKHEALAGERRGTWGDLWE